MKEKLIKFSRRKESKKVFASISIVLFVLWVLGWIYPRNKMDQLSDTYIYISGALILIGLFIQLSFIEFTEILLKSKEEVLRQNNLIYLWLSKADLHYAISSTIYYILVQKLQLSLLSSFIVFMVVFLLGCKISMKINEYFYEKLEF